MRADRIALALALTTVLVLGTDLSAHRQDEYLQAARIGVEPDHVELELDLTPGIAMADSIVAGIDGDSDGLLSAAEKREYVDRVFGAIVVIIDGKPLRVDLRSVTFPSIEAVRGGQGTIQIESTAMVPPLSDGAHRLLFKNTFRSDVSVYLANALVPVSDRIAVTAQTRDGEQSSVMIDFVVRAEPVTSSRVLPLGGMAGAVVLLVFMARRAGAATRLSSASR